MTEKKEETFFIEQEERFGAHNYHPLPVVLSKGQGAWVWDVNGNKYLVGYYVAEEGEEHDNEKVLDYLSTQLPEYMVPTVLVQLERLPLTINGKLDRNALPIPEFGSKGSDSYVGPRNEIEQKVCEIWAETLGLSVEQVGIRDDFFKLGGDSIISIQIVSRVRQRLSVKINVPLP